MREEASAQGNGSLEFSHLAMVFIASTDRVIHRSELYWGLNVEAKERLRAITKTCVFEKKLCFDPLRDGETWFHPTSLARDNIL